MTFRTYSDAERQLVKLGYRRGQFAGTWWRGAYVVQTAKLVIELGWRILPLGS